jgi:phage terminase large subunit-like protein
MEFPELKEDGAIDSWTGSGSPDSVIIEKKASGAPLIYELRAMGIPVQEYTPVRGNDKIYKAERRFGSICIWVGVWAPSRTRWADEVIDEVASHFPLESMMTTSRRCLSWPLMRFRKGGYMRTLLDEEDEQPTFRRNQAAYY